MLLLTTYVKLTKNTHLDKYKYSIYGIVFNENGSFLLSDSNGFGKNVAMFVLDISWYMLIDNDKKDIMTLAKSQTQGLDSNTLIAEKENAINFTEQQKRLF